MFDLLFHPDVIGEIEQFSPQLRAKTLSALDKLEAQGNQLRFPHTKPIREGLFELRAGGRDISRTFFAFALGKKIYILRSFIKKTQKTPQSEIAIAIKRLEEMTDESPSGEL